MSGDPLKNDFPLPAQSLREDVYPPLCLRLETASVRNAVPWIDHQWTYLVFRGTNDALRVYRQPAAFRVQNVEVMQISMNQFYVFIRK